jgi:hypothetical protein
VTRAILCIALATAFALAAHAGPASDGDGDSIPDVLDKCTMDSRNAVAPSTCDTDCDGYGNVCDPDFDQNFAAFANDYTMYFIPAFKGLIVSTRGQDMDCSGAVLGSDYTMYFVPKFKGGLGGAFPGPSGLACAGQPGCGC